MPRMNVETAQSVNSLSRNDSFLSLWKHFKALEDELQEQINITSTPKDEREILVHVKASLKREVIDVVKMAQEILERKEKLLGQT